MPDLNFVRRRPLLVKTLATDAENAIGSLAANMGGNPETSREKLLFNDIYLKEILLALYKNLQKETHGEASDEKLNELAEQCYEKEKKEFMHNPLNPSGLYVLSREKYMRQEIKKVHPQVISLGAGFSSTLLHKLKNNPEKYKNAKYFHVDMPEAITQFQKILETLKINQENYTLISSPDYCQKAFFEDLQKHGVDFSQKTLIVLEANTMYLSDEQVDKLYRYINEYFQGNVTIVCDYFDKKCVEQAKETDLENGRLPLHQFQKDFQSVAANEKVKFMQEKFPVLTGMNQQLKGTDYQFRGHNFNELNTMANKNGFTFFSNKSVLDYMKDTKIVNGTPTFYPLDHMHVATLRK